MVRPENPMPDAEALIAENCELRRVITDHPGWAADVTFADVWKWLGERERILSKPPLAERAKREGGSDADA